MVTLSCAVTTTFTRFEPTAKVIGPDVAPDFITVPLTVITDDETGAVGVNVADVVPLVTMSV